MSLPGAGTPVPDGLRRDERLRDVELPSMLLIECTQGVAEEWAGQMRGWVLDQERKARVPDPRPKLRKPSKRPS